MYVSLLLDVEDIVAPEADDITREVAAILSDEGITATFCVVGERVRQWVRRGRHDVIAALSRHDIGTHTDLHSVHPTVVEYLCGLDWDSGVSEAIRREAPAVHAIHCAFGRLPSCWGGPGNTWGPQINEAMVALDVPAQVYAHTRVPGSDVHAFCGLTCYPAGHYAGDGEYHMPDRWRANLARLRQNLLDGQARGRRWAEVFMGHPSRILHREFWDGPNFLHGASPEPSRWRAPARKTEADLVTALASFRATAAMLRDMPGITLRTIGEMNALAAESRAEPPTPEQVEAVTPEIERRVRSMAGWPVLPPDTDLDSIVRHTLRRLDTLRRIELPA
jgi:hypothetical protein